MIRLRLAIRNTWILSLYIFLLVCSVLMGSCSRTKQAEDLSTEKKQLKEIQEVVIQEKEPPKQIREAMGSDKEPPPMIQIQNFSLTDKTLTFDYRLSNPFKDDIWVCYDVSVYGKQDVQHAYTIIDGETVRIRLRCNFNNFIGFKNPPSVAKYIRLQPGESCSGRIVRNLPIKDSIRKWREIRKEHKEIILSRAIFEVGYFGSKWNKFLDSWPERFKNKPIKPELRTDGLYYYLSISPLITEETMDSQLREVMYLEEIDPFRRNEEFKEVVLNDVAIPCSIVDDDKLER